MKRRSILMFLLAFWAVGMANAQNFTPCITQELYEEYLHEHPEKLAEVQEITDRIQAQSDIRTFNKSGNVYQIPVVFHVIHEYGAENISKAQIEDQMRILNEDFRRLNADASNTRSIFQSVAADVEIEFVLAKKDPQGNCTEGIVRKYSTATNEARDGMKAVSYWPSNRYLNVWVVKSIESSGGDGTITAGYAQFPWDIGSRPTTDGVVVRADYVGSIGTSSATRAGRVLTHEVGHWLGLFHTFQGGCSGSGFWVEKIADTPPCNGPVFGCNFSQNTCTSDALPDQVENYMDYSTGSCQNMFTEGQKSVMHGFIGTYRDLLISPENATFTGIDGPGQACTPVADFSNVQKVVCQGSTVSFTDLSYNAPIIGRTWTFEGGIPSNSGSPNPTVTYNQAGTFKVTLEVSGSNGSNSIIREGIVTVQPAIGNFKSINEGLESPVFPPADWQEEKQQGLSWTRTTNASYSGNASMMAFINTNTPDGALASLITPPVDLLGVFDPTLRFQLAYARRGSSVERIKIYASDDCGQNFVLIYLRAGAQIESAPATNLSFVPTEDQWRLISVPLGSSLKDKRNVIFKFEVQSNSGNSMYIDDINIGSPNSIAPIKAEDIQLTVYPNPYPEQTQIGFNLLKQEKVSIELTDISGRQVKTICTDVPMEGEQVIEINTPGLEAGVYLVRLKIGESIVTSKVIKMK